MVERATTPSSFSTQGNTVACAQSNSTHGRDKYRGSSWAARRLGNCFSRNQLFLKVIHETTHVYTATTATTLVLGYFKLI